MIELAIMALAGCLDLNNISTHIHVHIEGMDIPKNIGISPGCFMPLHTHDTTGWIHLESSTPREFTLRQFFEIWGKPIEGIQPIIDGKWETMDTPLHDRDKITLIR